MSAHSKTVMIVDDDHAFLHVLSRGFETIGYKTLTAQSVDSAKDCIREVYPDFAIVDIHLGNENGVEIVEFLSESYPKTRCVVLSGYANIPSAVSSIKAGADECLPKPIDIEELDILFRRMSGEKVSLPDEWSRPNDVRQTHIINHLEKNHGNVSETAKKLGMHRRTLQRILRKAEC
ncbi:MAG: response regulator [Pseudomonadota bacterium]